MVYGLLCVPPCHTAPWLVGKTEHWAHQQHAALPGVIFRGNVCLFWEIYSSLNPGAGGARVAGRLGGERASGGGGYIEDEGRRKLSPGGGRDFGGENKRTVGTLKMN